jgi:hypothetical protein
MLSEYIKQYKFDYIQNVFKMKYKLGYSCVKRNPNIIWDIIQANLDNPNMSIRISENPGITIGCNTNLFKIDTPKVIREYFAKKTIIKHWRNAICNPEYKICKKRLQKEFNELSQNL